MLLDALFILSVPIGVIVILVGGILYQDKLRARLDEQERRRKGGLE